MTPSAFLELVKDLGPEAIFAEHDGRVAIRLRYVAWDGERSATFVQAKVRSCFACGRAL